MRLKASSREHIGLLFPEHRVYEDDIPEFLPDGKFVLYGEKNLTPEDSNIVFISKTEGVDISEKKGFIQALNSLRFMPVEEEILEKLVRLDVQQFWKIVKMILVCEISKKTYEDVVGVGSYALFEHLHKGYQKTFFIYKKTKQNHRVLMSSLLSMYQNCSLEDSEIEQKNFKPWFTSVVKENRRYYNRFLSNSFKYAMSPQREVDFLTFLVDMGLYS